MSSWDNKEKGEDKNFNFFLSLPTPKLKPKTMSPSYREEGDFEVLKKLGIYLFLSLLLNRGIIYTR